MVGIMPKIEIVSGVDLTNSKYNASQRSHIKRKTEYYMNRKVQMRNIPGGVTGKIVKVGASMQHGSIRLWYYVDLDTPLATVPMACKASAFTINEDD